MVRHEKKKKKKCIVMFGVPVKIQRERERYEASEVKYVHTKHTE